VAVAVGQPPGQQLQPLPPARVAGADRLLQLGVQGGQAAESAQYQPFGGPEAAEGSDVAGQRVQRVGLAQRGDRAPL
jgi:hypothetical protein